MNEVPSDEELRAAFEEQMRRIRVDDVLVQTAVTLVNLAGRRMGLPGPEGEREENPDLQQSKLAIDATRALVPLLPAEPQRAVRDALSQLQMAYVQAAGPSSPASGEPSAPGEQPGAPEAGPAAAEGASKEDAQAEAERAKARSKIWTPPGT